MERSPSSASTCLARARRERGQKRVPLPPARMTGRKSTAFGIEELSYPTGVWFAQVRSYYFAPMGVAIAALWSKLSPMFNLRQGSIHLFRIAGIDLFLHWSWFLVAVYEIEGRAAQYSSPV